MRKPLVSVIIPVYNIEKYLDNCLKSIVDSSYKNLEIIIVNDCSPDNSDKIINEYLEKDERIIYLKNDKNIKDSGSRNKGLEKSSGDYIMFIDGDDYISTDWIENMVKSIQEKKCDIVIGNAKEFKKNIIKEYKIKDLDKEKELKFENIRINKNSVVWNKIYKKSLIEKNNIRFDAEIFNHSDVEFTYKSLALADKILYVNKGFYYYRTDNQNSMMKTINYEEKIKFSTMLLKNIYDFSEKKGVKNKGLLKKLSGDVMEAYLKSNKKYRIEKSLLRKSGLFIPEIEHLKFLRKKIKNKFERELL